MAKQLAVATTFTARDKFSRRVEQMSRHAQQFSTRMQRGMARVQMASRAVITTTGRLSSQLLNLRNAAVAVGIGFVAKRAYDFASGLAATADEAAKMGRQLDMSASNLEGFRYAAQRSGVESSMLDSGMQTLNKRLGELHSGSGALRMQLEKMGKHGLVKQLESAHTTEEAFNIMSDAMKDAETQVERNTLAAATFSKGGMKLVRMMEMGSDELGTLRKRYTELAGTGIDEAAKKSEDFMDSQLDMQMAIEGVKIQIANALLPQIMELQKRLMGWIGSNRELISTKVEEYVNKVTGAVNWLVNNASTLIGILKTWIGAVVVLRAVNLAARAVLIATTVATYAHNIALGVMGALTGKVAIAVGANKTAMAAYNIVSAIGTKATWALVAAKIALLWPILAVIAAIVAIILVIRQLVKHWDTVVSVLRGVWEVIKTGYKIIQTYMLMPIKLLIKLVTGLGKVLYFVFTGQFKKALGAGREMFRDMKNQVIGDVSSMAKAATGMGKDFQKGFNRGQDQEMAAVQTRAAGPDRGTMGANAEQVAMMSGQGEAIEQPQMPAFMQEDRGERDRKDQLEVTINDPENRAQITEDTGGYVPQMEATL